LLRAAFSPYFSERHSRLRLLYFERFHYAVFADIAAAEYATPPHCSFIRHDIFISIFTPCFDAISPPLLSLSQASLIDTLPLAMFSAADCYAILPRPR
jgi:hypothetical protein